MEHMVECEVHQSICYMGEHMAECEVHEVSVRYMWVCMKEELPAGDGLHSKIDPHSDLPPCLTPHFATYTPWQEHGIIVPLRCKAQTFIKRGALEGAATGQGCDGYATPQIPMPMLPKACCNHPARCVGTCCSIHEWPTTDCDHCSPSHWA